MRTLLRNHKSVCSIIVLLTLLVLSGVGCTATPSLSPVAAKTVAVGPTPTALAIPTAPVSIERIARDIVATVGEVSSVRQGDSNRIIFVFEENHASRLGQIEIAVMLNRLYLNYSLRHIGLEGAMAKDGTLDASWFRPSLSPKQALGSRQDVAVQLLAEGEINSAELMALVYPDVVVHGIEKAEEYPLHLSDAASDSPIFYLMAIAEKSMTAAQLEQAKKLLEEVNKVPDAEKPQKVQDLITYMVGTNMWTKQQYDKLTDKKVTPSVEELSAILSGIEAKAIEVKATISPEDKAGLGELRDFYKARQAASDTMALNTLALAEKYAGVPVAMTIGSAHSARMAELLTAKGASFAIIKPLSLDASDERDHLSDSAYARKQNLLSVDGEGTLGRLLDNRWKPRSVLATLWFRSKAELGFLATEIARAARRGESIPFAKTLDGVLPELQYVRLDQKSFEMTDDGDVIFSVEAQTADPAKPWKRIWVRTRATEIPQGKTLEERLLEEREKVKQPAPAPDEDGLTLTQSSRGVITKVAPDYATIKRARLRRG